MSDQGSAIKEEAESKKTNISLWLDREVIALLDLKSGELDRSRSWFVNDSMRRDFGLPPRVLGGAR